MTTVPSKDDSRFRYWGFISYSHADREAAEWLHRAVERYRLPKGVAGRVTEAGTVPRRLVPIFRDKDELAGSSDLGDELREALYASRNLIVVCSPDARASKWVNEEIRTFSESGRSDAIFCVIARGDPKSADPAEHCFPPALPGEPLAGDLRGGRKQRLHARLRLIAGMVDVGFDDLKRRHRQRRIRQAVAAAFTIAALVTGFSMLGSYALGQRAAAGARTLAAASIAATDQDLDPIAGLELAIQAVERAPTVEALEALSHALEHQLSLVVLRHDTTVARASFSPDAQRILTCGEEPMARVWEVATGAIVHELTGTAASLRECWFSSDGTTILTAGGAAVRLWDASSGEQIAQLAGHGDAIASSRFSQDGLRIVTASADGTAMVWEANTGEHMATFAVSDEPLRAAFLIDGHARLLTIAQDGACALWDVRSGARLHEFGDGMPGVHTAVVSPAGDRLLVSNYQYRPWLWDLTVPRLIDGVMAMPHASGAAFTADGSEVAVGSGDGYVTVFDADEAYLVKRLQHPGQVSSFAFSPSGHLLVTGADQVRIWQRPVLGGGVDNPLGTLRGHDGWSHIAMFAPNDDELLLTIGDDRTVRVWDLSRWTPGSRPDTTTGDVAELLDRAKGRLPVRGSASRNP